MTTRVGFIGCGHIAQVHSRALKGMIKAGLVNAAVVATCDLLLERADDFAAAHGAALVTTDALELLAAVDAVWICTPTASHRALVEAAAGAGVHVFCEKPLATDLADARAMLAAVERAGVVHQVGLVLRSSPVFAAMRALLDAGTYGRPMAAVFRDDQYFPIQGFYGSTWRADVAQAGGGTLLEHSIHDLDLLRWLLGEVETVTARTANFAGHPGIEDTAVATLSFTSGATASLASVWHQVLTRGSLRRLEVFCEQALLWTEEDRVGPLHIETSAGVEVRECSYDEWALELPISNELWRRAAGEYAPAARWFLDRVAGVGSEGPGIDVGVAGHVLAEAVYGSAAEGGKPVQPALL